VLDAAGPNMLVLPARAVIATGLDCANRPVLSQKDLYFLTGVRFGATSFSQMQFYPKHFLRKKYWLT